MTIAMIFWELDPDPHRHLGGLEPCWLVSKLIGELLEFSTWRWILRAVITLIIKWFCKWFFLGGYNPTYRDIIGINFPETNSKPS